MFPALNQRKTGRFSLRWRVFFRRLFYFLVVFMGVWFIAVQAGCLAMRTPDREWVKKLREQGQTLTPRFCDIPDRDGRLIHAVSVSAADSLPWVVMVHGSPGASDAYLDYLADTLLSARVNMLSIDRPGFGYTQGFGRPEPSIEVQAAAVQAVVAQIAPGREVFLVGHSLGGPVIARFAMDYPGQTAGLILVAASIDPDLEEHPFWQSAIDPPPLKWLIPKSFWASNYEIRALEGELRKMLPLWEGIRCPVAVIHAQDDSLVPVGNADFAMKMLVHATGLSVEIMPDGDHFILWSRREKIRKAILDMVAGDR
ncbi:MAG: alpha/beta hydrolase [Saprospiraceae bacterium]